MFEHLSFDLPELASTTDKSGSRKYTTPDGVQYPSITTVLSAHSRQAIREWRERVGEEEANRISGRASRRGNIVHNLVEKYLNNESIDFSKQMPINVQAFRSIQKHLDRWIDRVYVQECPLYSDWLKLAGKVDCIAEFYGKPSVIDFKTKDKEQKPEWIDKHHMQCAGYAVMFEERTGIPVDRTVVICVVDGLSEPQLFTSKRDNHIEKLLDIRIKYEKGIL